MEPSKKAETKANYKGCPWSQRICADWCAWFNEENQRCIAWDILVQLRGIKLVMKNE